MKRASKAKSDPFYLVAAAGLLVMGTGLVAYHAIRTLAMNWLDYATMALLIALAARSMVLYFQKNRLSKLDRDGR